MHPKTENNNKIKNKIENKINNSNNKNFDHKNNKNQ